MAFGKRVDPVDVEERRRGGAVGEAEMLPRPVAAGGLFACDMRIPPTERDGERGMLPGDADGVALGLGAQPVGDDRLQWRHQIIVGQPVEPADVERLDRIFGNQRHRTAMAELEMLDDDRRLGNDLGLVEQHRHLGERPEPGQRFAMRRIVEPGISKGPLILPKRDQRLPAIRGERMGVEREHQPAPNRPRSATSPAVSAMPNIMLSRIR